MAFGYFTLTVDANAYGGLPATGYVQVDGLPQVVKDTAGDKIEVGPLKVNLDRTLGTASIKLPSDATTGNSTGIYYRASLHLTHQPDAGTVEFFAAPIGTAVAWADIVPTTPPVTPVGTVTTPLHVTTNGAGSALQLTIDDATSNPGFTLGGDTTLFRSGAGQLQTAQVVFIVRSTAGVAGLGITTSGDSTRRFQVNTDGKVLWSAGGAGAPPQDTTIIRDTTGGLRVANTSGTTATPGTPTMTLDASAAGVASPSLSAGGVFLVKLGNNPGAGINIHASRSTAATGRLFNITEAGTAAPVPAMHVDYAGTANGVEINYTGTGANGTTGPGTGQALNVVSSNPNDTAFGVDGHELSRGTIKGVHIIPTGAAAGADASASALSLRVNGTGTAAQGIFLDSDTGGTTGNLLTLRNGGFGNQVLTLDATGRMSVKGGMQVGSGTTPAFGGGVGVVGISNATTLPTTNPTGGGVLYAEGGALRWRGSAGTVTTLGPA